MKTNTMYQANSFPAAENTDRERKKTLGEQYSSVSFWPRHGKGKGTGLIQLAAAEPTETVQSFYFSAAPL